jgi:hypothetical protein
MLAKKLLNSAAGPSQYRKQLEYLYARISNIDAIIESLEEYDRFQAEDALSEKRKTA